MTACKICGMACIRVLFALVLASVAVQAVICGRLRRRFNVPGNWRRSEIGGTRVPNFHIAEELPPLSAANFSIFNGEDPFRCVRVHTLHVRTCNLRNSEWGREIRYAPPLDYFRLQTT